MVLNPTAGCDREISKVVVTERLGEDASSFADY
jgi:hypothetical protein